MPWDETDSYIRSGHGPREDAATCRTTDFDGKLPQGIKAIYCKYKKSGKWYIQSYLFPKSKGWTMEKAKKWFGGHKKESFTAMDEFVEDCRVVLEAMVDNSYFLGFIKEEVWDRKYIDDLPDSSFAHIESGGNKDGEGKTVPRSLRHLPYKDKSGSTDRAHLVNALARLPQTDISSGAKASAKGKLCSAVGAWNKAHLDDKISSGVCG